MSIRATTGRARSCSPSTWRACSPTGRSSIRRPTPGIGTKTGRPRRRARRTGGPSEIRIPLRVLRFDGSLPVQSWGFQATRFIADRQEADLWAYFPRDVASPVAFLGRLDDLRNLKAGGTLELRPFLLGQVARSDAGPNMAGIGMVTGRFARPRFAVAPRPGPDARRGLQPRLRSGRSGPGDPQSDQLRDAASREAAVLSGGDRRLLVSRCRCSIRDGSGRRRPPHDAGERGGQSHGNRRPRVPRPPPSTARARSWAASGPTGPSGR